MSNVSDYAEGMFASFLVMLFLAAVIFITAVISKDIADSKHEKQDTIKHRIEILENRVYELERRN